MDRDNSMQAVELGRRRSGIVNGSWWSICQSYFLVEGSSLRNIFYCRLYINPRNPKNMSMSSLSLITSLSHSVVLTFATSHKSTRHVSCQARVEFATKTQRGSRGSPFRVYGIYLRWFGRAGHGVVPHQSPNLGWAHGYQDILHYMIQNSTVHCNTLHIHYMCRLALSCDYASCQSKAGISPTSHPRNPSFACFSSELKTQQKSTKKRLIDVK